MKKIILFISFSLSILLNIHAQKKEKYWSDGPLTWNDFKEEKMRLRGSIPDYYLTYRSENLKQNNTTITHIKSIAYINTLTSKVSPISKESQILEYHQVEFDILELYRRQFQLEIYRLNSTFDIVAKHQETLQQIENTFSEFRRDANYGSNHRQIKYWSNKLTENLQNLKSDPIPKIENKNWGIGFYLGFEYSFLSNSLKNNLTPPIGLSFGFDTNYKRSYFMLNMGILVNKINNEFFLDEIHEENKKTGIAQGSIAYGYNFIESSTFNFIPFIGVGLTEFSELSQEEDAYSKITVGPHYGINVDYKFKTNINLVSNFTAAKTKTIYYLRTRLYIAHPNFSSNFKGNAINLGFIFGMYSKGINLKNN